MFGNVVEHHVWPYDGPERQLFEDAQAGYQILRHRITPLVGLEVHGKSRRAIQRVAGKGGRQGEIKRGLARAQGEGFGRGLEGLLNHLRADPDNLTAIVHPGAVAGEQLAGAGASEADPDLGQNPQAVLMDLLLFRRGEIGGLGSHGGGSRCRQGD